MNTDEQQQKPHHAYSPSTLQSLEACPCYRGRESTHERTVAGTRAHKVVETKTDDSRLGDDDAEAAAECLDFIARRKQLMADYSNLDVPALTELQEDYLPIDASVFDDSYIDPLTGKQIKERVLATTAGYIDHAIISHDRTYAEMIDFKFGMWAVERAENNLQGIAYALGLFRKYPTIQRIVFWFKQPHIDSITSADFSRDNIAALYLRIQTVVARARAARHVGDFSAATPAVPVCNFCALIGVCPKVAEFACRVGSKFYPLEIPSDITPSAIHTNRDTSLGLKLASVMSVWAEAFRRQTTDRVLRGDADIPEGHVIESRAPREIVDSVKFKEVSLQFVTEAEYANLTEPPGFGKLEDVISEKAVRGQKKAAIIDFKSKLESSGAVVKKPAYVFLKAVASKE